jgi:hypothetical protein
MVLNIKDYTVLPLTREDATIIIIASAPVCPDKLDFSDIASVSHCFADELFSRYLPATPEVVNATPFVKRILAAAAANA